MDIYKPKFTSLQQALLRFLSVKSGMSFTGRSIAQKLNVSPTAVLKSIKGLEKGNLIKVRKDKESKRLSIELNKDNLHVFHLKRIENLKLIYESGMLEYLSENLPGTTIILFGSYSFGEDNVDSDIDIAIIGSAEKDMNIARFEKFLERKISLNFYKDFAEIHKNLKENIFNGIILHGGISL